MAPEISSSVPLAPSTVQPQPAFLNRVTSYPLVNSALESAKTLYDSSKTRYQVLDQFETSVKTSVAPHLQPIIDSLRVYDAQLLKIDSFACSGLDLLESGTRIVDESIVVPVKSVATTVTTNVAVLSESLADRFAGPDEDAKSIPADATTYQRVTVAGARLIKAAPSRAQIAQLSHAADLLKYTSENLEEQLKKFRQFVATQQQSLAPAQQQLSTSTHQFTLGVIATLTTISTSVSAYLPETVRDGSARLQTLLSEQLININNNIRPTDSAFYHHVVEAGETARKYLDTVGVQLLQFYNSNVAQYIPIPSSTTTVESNGHITTTTTTTVTTESTELNE